MILMALMLAGAEPTVEAMALGRELAEQGTLTGLLTLLEAKETDDLVKEHPELSIADQATLRRVARQTFQAGFARVMNETAKGYVDRLTIEELRALVSFNRTPAAVKYRTISPAVIAQTMATIGPMNFKGDVVTNYCQQTGKLCGR
jgi:hypothetical protein